MIMQLCSFCVSVHETPSTTQLIFSPTFSLEVLDIAAECLLPEYPRASVATAVLSPSMGYLCLCCERVSAQHGPQLSTRTEPRDGFAGLAKNTSLVVPCWLVRWQVKLISAAGFNLSKTSLWQCLYPAVRVCVGMHIGEGVCFVQKHASLSKYILAYLVSGA